MNKRNSRRSTQHKKKAQPNIPLPIIEQKPKQSASSSLSFSKLPVRIHSIFSRNVIGKAFVKSLLYGARTEKLLLVGFLSFLLMFAISFVSYSAYGEYLEIKNKTVEKQKIQSDIVFWEEQIKKYPGFRDGYMQLALLYYQLGNKEEAKRNLEHALAIDPNFEKGRELEVVLNR